MKKFVAERPFSDPDAAARKIVEIANDVEAVQNGRIYIERVNAPFLAVGGTGDDFRARNCRSLPDGIETEMRENLMAKFGKMRVAAVAGIWCGVRDFRLDLCRTLAQHDNPVGKEQRLFHIVSHEQRGEASALPQ